MKRIFATLIFLLLVTSPAWAAFPQIASVGYSVETADTNDHDVVMPSGITKGDLLLWIAAIDGTPSDPLGSVPAGWNRRTFQTGASSVHRTWLFTKVATGTETNFQYTTDVAERSINRVFRISGAFGTDDEDTLNFAAASQTATLNPNPPTLDPATWATEDTLWIVWYTTDRGLNTVSSYPTNYSSNQFTDSTNAADSASDIAIGTASRNAAVSSEDPDTFTVAGATGRNTITFTIAVRPAVAKRRRFMPVIVQ